MYSRHQSFPKSAALAQFLVKLWAIFLWIISISIFVLRNMWTERTRLWWSSKYQRRTYSVRLLPYFGRWWRQWWLGCCGSSCELLQNILFCGCRCLGGTWTFFLQAFEVSMSLASTPSSTDLSSLSLDLSSWCSQRSQGIDSRSSRIEYQQSHKLWLRLSDAVAQPSNSAPSPLSECAPRAQLSSTQKQIHRSESEGYRLAQRTLESRRAAYDVAPNRLWQNTKYSKVQKETTPLWRYQESQLRFQDPFSLWISQQMDHTEQYSRLSTRQLHTRRSL